MTLGDPFWLVLAIPLAMALWRWRLPSRSLLLMRSAALVLLLLALCNLSVRLPAHCGTTVLVLDRSLSMPADSAAAQKEAADIIQAAMPEGDRLGVVSFAERAAIEQAPQAGKFGGCSADVGREASQLANALDLALSLLPPGEPGRVEVLSDGRWTGRDISAAAARAAAAGVAIDYRLMESLAGGRPGRAKPPGTRERPARRIVHDHRLAQFAAGGQTVGYELLRGQVTIARGKQAVPAGTSRLIFRDTAGEKGVGEYLLHVTGEGPDPVPENNMARLLVGVRAAKPLHCVTPAVPSGLSALLAKGGINVKTLPASQCNWSLEELAGYSGVLLENTPASLRGPRRYGEPRRLGRQERRWTDDDRRQGLLRAGRIFQKPSRAGHARLDGAAAGAPQVVGGHRRGPGPQRQHGDSRARRAPEDPVGGPRYGRGDRHVGTDRPVWLHCDRYHSAHHRAPLRRDRQGGHAGPGPPHRFRGRGHLYLRGPHGRRPHDRPGQGGHEAHRPLLRRRRRGRAGQLQAAGREVRQGGHHHQRRRTGHGEGLRRRAA